MLVREGSILHFKSDLADFCFRTVSIVEVETLFLTMLDLLLMFGRAIRSKFAIRSSEHTIIYLFLLKKIISQFWYLHKYSNVKCKIICLTLIPEISNSTSFFVISDSAINIGILRGPLEYFSVPYLVGNKTVIVSPQVLIGIF